MCASRRTCAQKETRWKSCVQRDKDPGSSANVILDGRARDLCNRKDHEAF